MTEWFGNQSRSHPGTPVPARLREFSHWGSLEGMSRTNRIISPELLCAVRNQYQLPWRGIHGVSHWARVLENGLRLAEQTGARIEVVSLFALFHDSKRENEGHDPHHGRRGSQLAAAFRGMHFELSDGDFALLKIACDQHTDGLTTGDVTIRTCWDADRLDLGRVGIRPDHRYLCTDPAKDKTMIAWAYERSIRFHVPELVSAEWDAFPSPAESS